MRTLTLHVLLASLVFAQESTPNHVTVTGHGECSLSATTWRIDAALSIDGKRAGGTTKAMKRRMAFVRKRLAELGDDVRIEEGVPRFGVSSSLRRSRGLAALIGIDRSGPRLQSRYELTQPLVLHVTLPDATPDRRAARVAEVLDVLADLDTRVATVSREPAPRDLVDAERDALAEALRDARTAATAYARSVGARVGKPGRLEATVVLPSGTATAQTVKTTLTVTYTLE